MPGIADILLSFPSERQGQQYRENAMLARSRVTGSNLAQRQRNRYTLEAEFYEQKAIEADELYEKAKADAKANEPSFWDKAADAVKWATGQAVKFTGKPIEKLTGFDLTEIEKFENKLSIPPTPNSTDEFGKYGLQTYKPVTEKIDMGNQPIVRSAGAGNITEERRITGTRVREGGVKPDGFNPHEPDFSGKNQNFGGFDL